MQCTNYRGNPFFPNADSAISEEGGNDLIEPDTPTYILTGDKSTSCPDLGISQYSSSASHNQLSVIPEERLEEEEEEDRWREWEQGRCHQVSPDKMEEDRSWIPVYQKDANAQKTHLTNPKYSSDAAAVMPVAETRRVPIEKSLLSQQNVRKLKVTVTTAPQLQVSNDVGMAVYLTLCVCMCVCARTHPTCKRMCNLWLS